MPLTIRQLPATNISSLIDKNSLPPNTTFFNPSRAGRYIYIRSTTHSETGEKNSAIIYDTVTSVAHNIPSPWTLLAPTVNLFQGIEDLRIVEYNGLLWFTGTCTHASDHQINDLIIGHFSKDLTTVERISAVDIGSRPVKNVCPFVRNGRLYILDIFFKKTYEIVDAPEGEGAPPPLIAVPASVLVEGGGQSIAGLRGSTSPVHLHGNIWGVVIHDIIYRNNKTLVTRLSYIHHWMEFDIERAAITFVSTPFYVAHWGIEYISGIHLDAATGTVMLYFGVEDKMAFQCATTLTNLRVGY